MKKEFVIKPQDVCSHEIRIVIDNDVIADVRFVGGCQGNTTGISTLVKGMKVQDVISKLSGIKCHGSKTGQTSCPDQLARALKSL